MSKEEISPAGLKVKAGKLLSAYLRQIGEEITEMITDPVTGGDRMATKVEALSRQIWRDALGYTEQIVEKGQLKDIYHNPSNIARAIIFDRMEGRAPLAIGESDEKLTAADRITEQGKKRITKAGKLDARTDNN